MKATEVSSFAPLLTIAIPTWNRADYLALNLAQLRKVAGHRVGRDIDIFVIDNASPDHTLQVVQEAIANGLPINYIRNDENIGSDRNIAKCFNVATGRYLMILGDDDLICEGVIDPLLDMLATDTLGVVCLRPYGYDHDFAAEYPGGEGGVRRFGDVAEFLVQLGPLMTLISGCIIHKPCLGDIDATDFIGGNLVQVHLVLMAALAKPENAMVDRYSVACKRNNSGGYDFSDVFVVSFGHILDSYLSTRGKDVVRAVEARFLLGYYPYYLFRMRLLRKGDLAHTLVNFANRFGDRWHYKWLIRPILVLPRGPALLWGAGVTLIGRLLIGDFRRGLTFLLNKLKNIFQPK